MTERIAVSINRIGKFKIKDDQFDVYQCGFKGTKEYTYEVSIEATDACLSEPDMFVMENGIVAEYFKKKYEVDRERVRSCEMVSCQALRDLKKIIAEQNPKADLQRITIIIRGTEVSFIKAEWKKEND